MFLESEPETALRVLTGSRNKVYHGMAAELKNLTAWNAIAASSTRARIPPTLAFAIVRVSDGSSIPT